jgi:hypothetical protein
VAGENCVLRIDMSCSLRLTGHFMADGVQENKTEHVTRKEEMGNT